MPDLVTHMAVNHLLRRPLEWRGKISNTAPFRTLFYLGTILPDITSRAINIAFPATMKWTLALHTPAGALVLIGILAFLFESEIRKKVFWNLVAGAGLHFFLDTFQTSSTAVFFWLFPFSWLDCGLYLIDAGDFIPWIPVWLAAVGVLECIALIRKRNPKKRV